MDGWNQHDCDQMQQQFITLLYYTLNTLNPFEILLMHFM